MEDCGKELRGLDVGSRPGRRCCLYNNLLPAPLFVQWNLAFFSRGAKSSGPPSPVVFNSFLPDFCWNLHKNQRVAIAMKPHFHQERRVPDDRSKYRILQALQPSNPFAAPPPADESVGWSRANWAGSLNTTLATAAPHHIPRLIENRIPQPRPEFPLHLGTLQNLVR